MKIDLSTKYMGLDLRNPVIVGSSSLTGNTGKILQLEKAGAGAIVLKSLFEEQILVDKGKLISHDEMYFWYPEAIDFVNNSLKGSGLEAYLRLLTQTKKSVKIPVIASINCITDKEWPSVAGEIEKAGADALELNIAIFPLSRTMSSSEIENQYVSIIRAVKKQVRIPVAVKLGPYFTNLYLLTQKLHKAGANAFVLFNRFFSPDIDINRNSVTHENLFSTPEEMAMTLRWVGLISSGLKCDIAASTGVHSGHDVVKQLLMGASAAQVCSTLYLNGTKHLKVIIDDLSKWMAEHGHEKISDFQGAISNNKTNLPYFERLQFMKKTSGDILSPGGDI